MRPLLACLLLAASAPLSEGEAQCEAQGSSTAGFSALATKVVVTKRDAVLDTGLSLLQAAGRGEPPLCSVSYRPFGCVDPQNQALRSSCDWPQFEQNGCGPMERTDPRTYGYEYGFGWCSMRTDNTWAPGNTTPSLLPHCTMKNQTAGWSHSLNAECKAVCDAMGAKCIAYELRAADTCMIYAAAEDVASFVPTAAGDNGLLKDNCGQQGLVASTVMEPTAIKGTYLAKAHCYRKTPQLEVRGTTAGFRFAKHGMSIGYPVGAAEFKALATTKAVSVRTCNSSQVYEALSFMPVTFQCFPGLEREVLKRSVKLLPTHPDAPGTGDFTFWTEFEEVVWQQIWRRRGTQTKRLMSVHPLFDENETYDASAQRVRADFPNDFPTALLKRFFGQGLALDENIVNHPRCTPGKEFVNGKVALGEMIGWAINTVSPVCFMAKWFVGRARPEEVAWNISKDPTKLKAPERIVRLIQHMNLTSATSFTAYPEGSPVHPSYPAMHSAASSMSTWLDVFANLTAAQRAEARLLDYSVAYFRTLAGVHYESDNRAGLSLGQYIVKKNLPAYLGNKFGCDQTSKSEITSYVAKKVARWWAQHPLDWATWLPPKWVQ